MSGIGGNTPTFYQYNLAEDLKTATRNLADKISSQIQARASYVRHAREEFRGQFADIFERNAELSANSATALLTELGRLPGFVDELIEAAREEDERREAARAWEQRQRDRENNFLIGAAYEVGTFLRLVDDDPHPPAPKPEPSRQTDPVTVRGREIATRSDGHHTSSAVPEALRGFQSGTQYFDDEVQQKLSAFERALGLYDSGCNARWGTLTADSLATAVRTWLAGNSKDVEFVGLVAEAFEAAGSGSGVVTVADASMSAALASAGADYLRDDFTIEPFSAVGTPPTNGFADDPVNTATGNFLEPENDLEFQGAAASLRFTRMYNSLDDRTGAFGLGWSSVLDTRVEFTDHGASFVMADGRQIDFPRAGDGWDRGVGENYWLTATASATLPQLTDAPDKILKVTDNSGGWWAFNTAGRWLGAGTGAGTTVTVMRDATGQITRLAHERGRFLDVEYTGDRVASIHASDGRHIEYLYDDQRRVISVNTAVGTRTYRWNGAGLIDQVVSETGVVECENFYDEHGRVIRQLTPYGRSVRFAYLRGRVTSVSTDDGTGANTWIADTKGRVVGIIDADGNRQSMAYDPHGNIVSSTDRDGRVTVHAYDDHGRKTRTVTPAGADITYGYDEFDRVTTVVTAAGGVVEYEYATEAERNPSIIIDPMGGRSELTWHNGLLQRVVDPEGVTVSLRYDVHGELTGVTNANGDTAHIVRDDAGRLIEIISPSGYRTAFRYSAAGPLIAREDPDGAIWRFEHGTGGRLTAVVDPYGHRTEIEYGVHGEISKTTDPLGRVTTQDFDQLGNLAGMTLPDGAQWTYVHDALSRLREITDPAGGTWTYNYDATGELTSAVDPTGVRTDIRHSRDRNLETIQTAFEQFSLQTDEYGRLVKTEQTDGTAELISYDAAGRPVEFVDAEGGLTKVERDLAGRITAITTPQHRTMRYEYDACGRPAVAIDPAGGRTVLEYDADSRVISRTSPAGEVSTLAYDAMGRTVREDIPGVGVAQYHYDKLGRLTRVQDSRYGQRRFAYDAAGQLIKAINGLGGETCYDYDERGRVTRVTDPVGGVTTFTYNHLDAVVSVTDPLNRAVKTTYDPAGRKGSQTDPDGNVTEWTYDDAGRQTTVSINGQLVSQIIRDDQYRSMTIRDATQGSRSRIEHHLTYNRRGQLARRATTTGHHTEETHWEYDADGYRTSMTTPDGTRITYDRDRSGRAIRIHHGTFGEAIFDYDADGRPIQARAGDQLQTWEYENGYPVVHTDTSSEGTAVTRIERDAQGRIVELAGAHGTTRYEYDQACQLTAVTAGGLRTTWTYDPAGRIITQTRPDGEAAYLYDRAGQLLMVKHPTGKITTYEYDGRGQRIFETTDDATTKYSWDTRGWLTRLVEGDTDGTRETDLSVNAFGELTAINDTCLNWDLAADVPSLLSLGDAQVYQGPAGLTGLNGTWQTVGWRAARATDHQDPWQTLAQVAGHPSTSHDASGLGADGSLQIAGLQWMGARPYDPDSSSFLSQDPIPAPLGAAWATNPYSYAGNDPLHALDPHGLAPISDAELQAYADGLQGPLATFASSAWDWTKNNWESIAAVGVIAGGVALTLTGVGGPAGIAMMAAGGAAIGGGISVVSQQATSPTGEIDWSRVGTDALVGTIGAGVTGLAGRGLTQAAQTLRPAAVLNPNASRATQVTYSALRSSATRGAISSGAGGSTSNMTSYHFTAGENASWRGYLQSGSVGLVSAAAGSYGVSRLTPITARGLGNMVKPPAGAEVGRRSAGPYTCGHFVGELGVDHIGGGLQSAANEMLRDTGNNESPQPLRAGIQGLLTGGSGYAPGLLVK